MWILHGNFKYNTLRASQRQGWWRFLDSVYLLIPIYNYLTCYLVSLSNLLNNSCPWHNHNQIIFKKSKQPFSSRYCGSRNFCKKHDIIKPNFYTILHNLASSITILKHASNFAFWYQIWNWMRNVRHIIFRNKCPFISWYAKVAKICEIILSLKFHLFVKFLRLTFFRK